MDADLALPDAAARAARARARAGARLHGTMDDLFLPDDARLDARTRLMLAQLLTETVAGIEAELRRRVERLLDGHAAPLASGSAAGLLTAAGLLRDDALIGILIAHVRQRTIAAALPSAAAGPEGASLLVRLAAVPDRMVATGARTLLAADAAAVLALPMALQRRLVWWIAAAIRPSPEAPVVDRAIAEAARRSLDAHDEEAGAAAAAMRLATAIDARPDELAPLLLGALGDRRLSLFVAVLAHAVGLDFDQALALVLEPEGERLWLALRAVRLDRPTIARIALALSDADPRRDIEAFADRLDHIAAVDPAEALDALAPETFAPEFRRAIEALAG